MRTRLLSALALAPLLAACTSSDLRPPELREQGPSGAAELRGRQLLDQALEAVGGPEAWQRYTTAELQLADEWRGWIGSLFRPWPGNPTRLLMHYDLGMRGARAEFLSEERRGEVWGRDGERTWSQKPGGERKDGDRESVRFIFAAYQYFFELPLRIREAPIVAYAGRREREGRWYELVFATWGRPEPHREHDQYLLWIAEDTGRIEIAQYTIRDKFHFAKGSNVFSDFRTVQDVVLPHAYRIAQELDDEQFVHRVQLEDVRLLP